MEIIQKYLKKRSKRVGAQISGSTKDISQVKTRSARFRRHSRGLRNNFATPSYLRKAAKLASTLRFSTPSLRHISGNFRRKSKTLYKKAAKFSQQKAEISQTLKRAAKYFRNNKLNSQGCEIGFHLEVLNVPACGMYRVASGGIP